MAIKLKSRIIQKVANYSFYITVPKIWLNNHQLKAGDSVDMSIDRDGRLILEAVKSGTKKTKSRT